MIPVYGAYTELERGSICEETLHGVCRVPVSVNSISFASDFSDLCNLGRCELYFQRTQILLEILEGKNMLTLP